MTDGLINKILPGSPRVRAAFILVFLSLFLAAAGLDASAQSASDERVVWLKENATAIRGNDPADADFSDLMPLVEKIGKARVVLLGEQSHGDGPVFLMKDRLVRFLHEVLGFDVLAWESGLFDCREMEAALHSGIPLEEAIAKGIFGIWGRSAQVRPVFEYARSTYNTPRPLEMAGFDCQFSAPASAESFPKAILEFLDRSEPKVLDEPTRARLLGALNFRELLKLPAEERKSKLAFMKTLPGLVAAGLPGLAKFHSAREIAFWTRLVNNLPPLYAMMDAIAEKKEKMDVLDNNIRDRAMGETLLWLAREYYPDRKIIVWAASFHNMREGDKIDLKESPLSYKGLITMGQLVFDGLKDEAYSIAFTAFQGKAGSVFAKEPFDIGPAAEGGLDDLCHKTGLPFLFVDLRGLPGEHWLRQPIIARPLGHSPMPSDWGRQFDAFIFTDVMTPSTPLAAPSAEKK